ncbi:MAG: hypothetical protein HXY23_08080 [Parvularculaceae bacterium]|nr:hypothetical protein [Parvularculaceae bacterium]
MSKLDKLIEDALTAEDQALCAQFEERGMLGDVATLFGGKYGPWNILTMIIQILAFAGVLHAGRQFVVVDDMAALARWGALAALLFAAMSFIKLMRWRQAHANRVIREIKRVELQLARAGKS